MKKLGSWLNQLSKKHPFFSVLIVLIMVVVPGYWQLETAVQTANKTAAKADETAAEQARLAESQNNQEAANDLANCQTRNTATKNGRDRFDTFFTVFQALVSTNVEQTPEERQQAIDFFNDLRAGVNLDPTLEDVDCNGSGSLDPGDYG